MAGETFTRETFVRGSGAAGVALLGGTLGDRPGGREGAWAAPHDPPVRNLVISCEENHSFDSYFGFAPQVQARGFGPPPGFAQPDAEGVLHPVFEQTALRTDDPDHSWAGSHLQYDGGRTDGFFRSSARWRSATTPRASCPSTVSGSACRCGSSRRCSGAA
jgi:phospholipase C